MESEVKAISYKMITNTTDIKDPLRNVKGTEVHADFKKSSQKYNSAPQDNFRGPDCSFSGSFTSLYFHSYCELGTCKGYRESTSVTFMKQSIKNSLS